MDKSFLSNGVVGSDSFYGVSKKIDPKTVTLEMAIELLAKKQARKFKPRHATTNTTV